MASVQDWKTTQCAGTEDNDHIRAIEALASLLENDITPADAAQSITTAYAASLKAIKEDSGPNRWIDTKLANFWANYMTTAIECFGSVEAHARLTNLLVEISELPDLKDDDGVVVKTYHQQTFWSDLPGWGFRFANNGLYYAGSQEFFPEEKGDFLAQIPRLITATRFAANLLQKGSFAFALPLEASRSLRAGLEYSYDKDSFEGPHADDAVLLIPAATTWLLFAGETIYEHCFGGDTSNGWIRGPWNLERWDLWKTQLTDFVVREDFSEECRDLAEKTAKHMMEIEGGHQG